MFRGRLILTSNTGITLSDRFQRQTEERRRKAKERFEQNRQRAFNANRGLDSEAPKARVRLSSGGSGKFVTIVEPAAQNGFASQHSFRRSVSSSSSTQQEASWRDIGDSRGGYRGRGWRGGGGGSRGGGRGGRGQSRGGWQSRTFLSSEAGASLVGPSGRPRQLLRANSNGRGGQASSRGANSYRRRRRGDSVFDRLS